MVDIAKNNATDRHTTTVPATKLSPRPLNVFRHGAGAETEPDGLSTPARHGSVAASADRSETQPRAAVRYLLAGIRIALGWIFLWAFLDKTFGLGHDTTSAKSWLNGGSPTKGFLGSAAKGPFTNFYHSIAGTGIVDALFMAALLGIGAALILGIGIRLAAAAGALLTVMMWSAVLPPASNPFMDEHLIYAAVLVVLALLAAGNTLGLGRAWAATSLVKRASWLK
jgi:thiosulfate dehydrogenase [quinone] large subunit